jgi:hypothetical protein
MTAPDLLFSVIVPTYNRAGMILRAVRSALASGRADLEVLVIDDCSTDDTVAVIEGLGDPRVRLLRQAVNRGVCEARNAGVAAARGRWLLMLDSDFEVLPGGLETLAARCAEAPADVGNVATVCRWDRGPDTPDPTPAASAVLDFAGYLAFVSTLRIGEWFNCYRREVFGDVRYPRGRAYESSFHLAAAARWRFWMCVDRVVLIHTDATNRITASPPRDLARRQLRDATDGAADADAVLRAWSTALRAHAPGLLAHYEAQRVIQHLLAGHRLEALGAWLGGGASVRRSPRVAAFVALGLVGPRALAYTQSFVSEQLRRRRGG